MKGEEKLEEGKGGENCLGERTVSSSLLWESEKTGKAVERRNWQKARRRQRSPGVRDSG